MFNPQFKLVDKHGEHTLREIKKHKINGLDYSVFNSKTVTIKSLSNFQVSSSFVNLEGRVAKVLLQSEKNESVITSTYFNSDYMEESTRWILYSSGTSGQPSLTGHTLDSLIKKVRTSVFSSTLIWGQLYDPNKMAGIQVILQSMICGNTLLAPEFHMGINEKLKWLIKLNVNALSATPSLWRRILQSNLLCDYPLKQITLGGEIVDQKILDSLHSRFPKSRITQIYASTETGVGFSVRDRQAGFPASYVENSGNVPMIRIVDSELHIYNPNSDKSNSLGFVNSGDRVELINDRYYFKGRSSGEINVAGSKILPEVIEAVLLSHINVAQVVVTAKFNNFTGNVIVANVVAIEESNQSVANLESELKNLARLNLPKYAVPAIFNFLSSLEISESGKAKR